MNADLKLDIATNRGFIVSAIQNIRDGRDPDVCLRILRDRIARRRQLFAMIGA